jgi:hypothetical protein
MAVQSEALTYSSRRDPRWKRWTMRAIENLSGRRALLPIYYRWRMEVALLVSEFRRCVGGTIRAHVGEVVAFADLEARKDRNALTAELYARVHRLAPGAAALGPGRLEARPANLRRKYPWDAGKGR